MCCRRRSGGSPAVPQSPSAITPPPDASRQVYVPSESRDFSRPGTASVPVRPVSAATWNRAMSDENYCRDSIHSCATQGNRYSDSDGIGGDVLADPAPRVPGTPNLGSMDAQSAQARLAQQKQLAQQKRMERLQGGSIAQQNLSPVRPGSGRPGSSRPGTAGGRPGTASRPGTGLNMSGLRESLTNDAARSSIEVVCWCPTQLA
eukprot:scaffold175368_cov53-Prasinocladus_malaysianus.AAC.1